ncbi:insecticidal toxin complex protein TccC [Pseudomonas fluorescens]|uniref:RHS repeat-associated core domain-containing protein n=1 Tax=Pseudomonas fluorescens TaxID=294 RepID=UPI00209E18D8|nr:RHS repeat-associated core domain-containing protein [Pseudomonas fluorescens]MCP1484678.1 insecticidal toxin complex protein TccC [Pseudomonas fluorescens]MCP1488059.1 insecticidal toxin complex protein TccC [Pseudomonas fluorescens]
MSTSSNLSTAQLCSGTPTVAVIDNRGLSVRTLQYNRSVVGEVTDERVTQQHFNVLGQLLSSTDPRFYSAQQSDPAVLPNFRYQHSLSGQVLLNQSQDAGRYLTLLDVEGGPVWQENSHGFFKRFTYDALHRVSAVYEQDGADAPERVSERYVYGQQAGSFDTFGRLLRHYDTTGLNEVQHYNYRGQPLQTVRQLLLDDAAQSDWPADETQCAARLEAERYSSSVTYNALDEVLGTVDALGNQQQRYLDVAGQLASSGLTLAADSEERPVLASITYSAAGQVLREVAGNGVVSTYTYEPQTLRLSRLTATRPALVGRSTLLQDLSYTYDPVGNILSIDDAAIATSYANNQQVEPVNAYQYDALYQLCAASGRENTGASRQGPILPVAGGLDANQYSNYSRQYRYDRGGNLTQMRHVGFSSYTLDMQVSNTSNRAVAQTGFLTATDVEGQFDAAGNLQQLVAGQPLAWDGRNQLQRVTQIQRSGADDDEEHYQYDGAGARVRKTMVSQTSGTTRRAQVIYLPGLELRRTQRTQGTTTATEEELHVLSLGSTGRQQVRLLHWVTGQPTDIPNNQLRGSLGNQIGSSVLELDQNADVLTQEEYYPFGGTAVWSGKNTSETKYKFVRYSGKERDATGLYYYGFRYYAPWLGRWISPDPGGTVDGLNLFRFVRGNPVGLIDPNGMAPQDVDEAYQHMLSTGTEWATAFAGANKNYADFKHRAALNFTLLKDMALNPAEHNFVEGIKGEEFYAVHFSEGDHQTEKGMVFRSRKNLQSMGIKFKEDHTTDVDLLEFATDDFSFFSLEIGASPKKPTSRFGAHRYRIPLTNVLTEQRGQHAHIQSNEMTLPAERPINYEEYPEKQPDWLHNKDIDGFNKSILNKVGGTEVTPIDILFDSENIAETMARSIVKDIRNLKDFTPKEIYSADTSDVRDKIVNSFYRPQLLVPSRLLLKRGEYKYTPPRSG